MHFLNAIIVSLIAGGATAFTLPAGLEDGTYSAHYNKEGREVHERLATADNIALTIRQEAPGLEELSLSKRQEYNQYFYYCGCGFTLDPGDCDAAVADLSNQLNKPSSNGPCATIPEKSSYYSIRGSVVAFICVGAGINFYACGQDYGDSLKAITSHCGLYIAGSEGIQDWGPDFDTGITPVGYEVSGYMRYSSGLDFCYNSVTSPVSSC